MKGSLNRNINEATGRRYPPFRLCEPFVPSISEESCGVAMTSKGKDVKAKNIKEPLTLHPLPQGERQREMHSFSAFGEIATLRNTRKDGMGGNV
jgi:hypothetical protein